MTHEDTPVGEVAQANGDLPREQPEAGRDRPLGAHCACGCGVTGEQGPGRLAIGVDPGVKERNHKRLRRIEGQIRGLQKMVDEERYCADILTQISSVHEALRAVGRELMRNHLKYCAATAIQRSEADAEAMYDELVEMMYRHSR